MIAILTKEDAERLLALNAENRELDMDKVNDFKDQINNGEWRLTGSKLKVENGIFKNGQHRLHAFLASTQQQFMVNMEIL